jgi:hypothetical protein
MLGYDVADSPVALNDFLDYNEFLDTVDIAAAEPEFEDVLPDADRIADVNIETLKKLGRDGREALGMEKARSVNH